MLDGPPTPPTYTSRTRADPPVADQLAGEPAARLRAALAAGLHHPAVPPRRLDHRPALADRQRERLFDVHVFAPATGRDRGNGVPVVGRGDADRVDVVPFEQLAEVAVDPAIAMAVLGVDQFLRSSCGGLVHVADGDILDLIAAEEDLQIDGPKPAHPDMGHDDPLAGRRPARGAQGGRRDHHGRRHRAHHRPQKLPPGRTSRRTYHGSAPDVLDARTDAWRDGASRRAPQCPNAVILQSRGQRKHQPFLPHL